MRGQRGKVAFFSRRADAFFVVLALLLLFSCGLPTSDYLYPPAGFSSPSGNLVQLVHDTRNIYEVAELFKGYDIYYRIFDSQEKANESSTKLSNETSGNITSVASLEGYYVLVKYQNSNLDTNVPLIPVPDNSYDYFDLNLKSTERWTITSEDETTIYSIVRDKKTATSTDADFYLSANYEKGDLDYDYEGEGISDNDGGSVYIVFFAVAYGISSSSIGSELYSDPIVLLPIQYTPMGGS